MRVRERRISMGMTQQRLAELMHRTKGLVSQYELGLSTPTTRNLQALAAALRCDVRWLLIGQGQAKLQQVTHRVLIDGMCMPVSPTFAPVPPVFGEPVTGYLLDTDLWAPGLLRGDCLLVREKATRDFTYSEGTLAVTIWRARPDVPAEEFMVTVLAPLCDGAYRLRGGLKNRSFRLKVEGFKPVLGVVKAAAFTMAAEIGLAGSTPFG